jgi:hypothetical protein
MIEKLLYLPKVARELGADSKSLGKVIIPLGVPTPGGGECHEGVVRFGWRMSSGRFYWDYLGYFRITCRVLKAHCLINIILYFSWGTRI